MDIQKGPKQDRSWKIMGETKIYYHATPYENLTSILGNGIQPSFGQVYCSTNSQAAVNWICFTRRTSAKIVLIPFEADSDNMSLGVDHSPVMTKMLGVPDEGASYVSNETISPRQIVFDEILVYENPFYVPVMS